MAVHARIINNKPIWGTSGVVDATKFCDDNPDTTPNTPDVCIYMAHKSESWCNSGSSNRLDDKLCSDDILRICAITL